MVLIERWLMLELHVYWHINMSSCLHTQHMGTASRSSPAVVDQTSSHLFNDNNCRPLTTKSWEIDLPSYFQIDVPFSDFFTHWLLHHHVHFLQGMFLLILRPYMWMRLPGIIDMHYFKAPREQFPCSPDGDRVGGSLEKDRVGVEGGDCRRRQRKGS